MWLDWEEKVIPMQKLIMKPIIFKDLVVKLINAELSRHGRDYVLPAHRHPWYEFCYLSKGSYFTNMEGKEFLIEAGSFYLVPPGCFHSHRNNGQEDDGFCLCWQLDTHSSYEGPMEASGLASQMMEVLSLPRPFQTKANAGEFILSIQEKSELEIEVAFIQFLVWLYSMWKDEEEALFFEKDHEKVLVDQAFLYLREYYSSDITVQDVARALNISYRHLARIFKKATGMTLIEKLNDIRIHEAKNMLKSTDKTIKEVADEVGFKNEYYFSRKFSEYTNISPSKFRAYTG